MAFLVAGVSLWSRETGPQRCDWKKSVGAKRSNYRKHLWSWGQKWADTNIYLRNVTRPHLMLYRGTLNQIFWAGEDFKGHLDQQAQHLLGMGKKCKCWGPTRTFGIKLCRFVHTLWEILIPAKVQEPLGCLGGSVWLLISAQVMVPGLWDRPRLGSDLWAGSLLKDSLAPSLSLSLCPISPFPHFFPHFLPSPFPLAQAHEHAHTLTCSLSLSNLLNYETNIQSFRTTNWSNLLIWQTVMPKVQQPGRGQVNQQNPSSLGLSLEPQILQCLHFTQILIFKETEHNKTYWKNYS